MAIIRVRDLPLAGIVVPPLLDIIQGYLHALTPSNSRSSLALSDSSGETSGRRDRCPIHGNPAKIATATGDFKKIFNERQSVRTMGRCSCGYVKYLSTLLSLVEFSKPPLLNKLSCSNPTLLSNPYSTSSNPTLLSP